MAHIANGRDPGNCVSLLRVNVIFPNKLVQIYIFIYIIHLLNMFILEYVECKFKPEQHADTSRELY